MLFNYISHVFYKLPKRLALSETSYYFEKGRKRKTEKILSFFFNLKKITEMYLKSQFE